MLSAITVCFYMTPCICSNWFLPCFFYVCPTFISTQWLTYGKMLFVCSLCRECLIGVLGGRRIYITSVLGFGDTNLCMLSIPGSLLRYHVLCGSTEWCQVPCEAGGCTMSRLAILTDISLD